MGEIIFFIFLGMAIGVIVLTWLLEQGVRQMQERTSDELVDRALEAYKEYTIPLNCEKEGDIYYCYNDRDQTFACQGRTIEEITENFKLRFPDYGSYITRKCAEKYFPEMLKKQAKTNVRTKK